MLGLNFGFEFHWDRKGSWTLQPEFGIMKKSRYFSLLHCTHTSRSLISGENIIFLCDFVAMFELYIYHVSSCNHMKNISEVRVEGLETLNYLDNLQNRETFTEQGDALTFEGEVNTYNFKHNSTLIFCNNIFRLLLYSLNAMW